MERGKLILYFEIYIINIAGSTQIYIINIAGSTQIYIINIAGYIEFKQPAAIVFIPFKPSSLYIIEFGVF